MDYDVFVNKIALILIARHRQFLNRNSRCIFKEVCVFALPYHLQGTFFLIAGAVVSKRHHNQHD